MSDNMNGNMSNTVSSKVKKLLKIATVSISVLAVSAAAISITGCAKKVRGGSMDDEGEMGVGDSMTFYGSELTPAQERELLARNTYYFDYDSNSLSEEDTLSVYAHAKKLMTKPRTRIRIEGHTDERGSREYNVALGDRRAKAISDILKLKGVPESRISLVSYGKEKPANKGHEESSWSLNRRGMIVYESE